MKNEMYEKGYWDCADFCGCDFILLDTAQEKRDYARGWNQACDDFPNSENQKIDLTTTVKMV